MEMYTKRRPCKKLHPWGPKMRDRSAQKDIYIYIYIYIKHIKCSNDSSRLWWNWQFCKDLKIGVIPFPSIGLGRQTTTTLHRITLAGKSAVFTLHKKQFFDSSLLSDGFLPYREWASLVSCLVFSTRAHTSLRMLGGAIPASKYRSSTLVGFRHFVTALHALFSSVFSFWAWDDLAQTGAAYSATE